MDHFLGGRSISNNNDFHSNFTKYWNQATPGNSGKWQSVESSPDIYNWVPLDTIYHYALAYGFPYKHHCLIWGNQQPAFMTDGSLDSATERAEIENWIRLVGQRYPKMTFVDVVNEPFHAPPAYANALGGNGTTGWDWVVTAFTLARQYCDTSVKLILNEYTILQDNAVTTRYIALIDTLKVRGLIDAIGIQGHYFEFKGSGYTYSISTIKSNLDRLAATGLPIYISEFDINEADDNTQLQNYITYFPIFLGHPAMRGVTLWGYIYGDMWQVNAYLLNDRNAERPALQWLRTYILTPPIPALISPVTVKGTACNPSLLWQASDSATSYHIQVSTQRTFPSNSMVVDTTIVDTFLRLNLLDPHTTFYWHVNAANNEGTSDYSVTAGFTTGDQITSVDIIGEIPTKFSLTQNYPNPFNPSTTIRYDIPKRAYVKITIYDVLGKVVATLIDGIQSANTYSVEWNPLFLCGGVYFCHMQALNQDGSDNFTSVKKLLFMK